MRMSQSSPLCQALLVIAGIGLAVQSASGATRVTNRAPEAGFPSQANVKLTAVALNPAQALDGVDLDRVVQDLYGKFSDISESSGHRIQLTAGSLNTYMADELDKVPWWPLFTPPTGWALETVQYRHVAALPSETAVSYRSTWKELDASVWYSQDYVKEGTLTAREALDQLRERQPSRFANAAAVSSFEVDIELDGRNRSYRAAIVWTPLPSNDLLFSLVDHVVPGVDLTFHESRTVVTLAELEALRTAGPGTLDLLTCQSGQLSYAGPLLESPVLRNGHVDGFHYSYFRVHNTCTTSSNCRQTCSSSAVTGPACVDIGNVSGINIHKIYQSATVSSVAGANGDAAECGYAWGCAVRQCIVGFCGSVSFGVQGRGASLTISPQNGVLDNMSLNYGFTCPISVTSPPSCSATTSNVQVLALNGPAVDFELSGGEVSLTRVESSDVIHHGRPLRYLMGEWALIGYTTGKLGEGMKVRTLAASSDDFAASQVAQLSWSPDPVDFLRQEKLIQEQTALLVAVPPHPLNERHIPMPKFVVAPRATPIGSGSGRVLVRADFGEDHRLQQLDILHDTLGGGVTPELAIEIEKGLALERLIEKDHRVVVFATISVGDTLKLVQAVSYLPQCCGPPCPPPPYECW